MNIFQVEATTISDAWFQAVYNLLEVGRQFKIDKGSFAGQTRLEYDYFLCRIRFPGMEQVLPTVPPGCGLPDPVAHDYVYGGPDYERSYVEYVMTPTKQAGESYTYGERLTQFKVTDQKYSWYNWKTTMIIDYREADGKIVTMKDDGLYVNQIEWIIDTYKQHGHRNNQMVLQVAMPDDCMLTDPPCLRSIDTRIQDDKLHFVVYFRSWDLWGGFPANLAGISELQKYMAGEIGVEQGTMIVESKGLHLYGYAEDLAKMRCFK